VWARMNPYAVIQNDDDMMYIPNYCQRTIATGKPS